MGKMIPFPGCYMGLSTPFDQWHQQCYDAITDFKGGRDVWGFLIDAYGQEARKPEFLSSKVGPWARCVQKELALPDMFVYTNLKRSLTLKYGPAQFPLNILLYLNDKLRWTPEQFRTSWLEWEYKLSKAINFGGSDGAEEEEEEEDNGEFDD